MRSSCDARFLCVLTLTLLACTGEELETGGGAPAGNGGQNPTTGGTAGAAGQPGAGQGGAGSGGMAGAGAGGEAGGNGGEAGISGSSGQAGAAGTPSGTPCTEPGTFACINNTLLICSPNTKILEVLETCSDDGQCDEASGKCLQCKPGAIVGCLDDKNQSMCDADGTPSKAVPCPEETPFCNKGKCVICKEDSDCPALDPKDDCNVPACSQNACVGKPLSSGSKPASQEACTLRLCDGNGGSTVTPLEAGVACEQNGVCNGNGGCGECIPGVRECTDGSSFRVCDENGKWQKPELCSEKPACDAGTCQGVVQMATSPTFTCALLENRSLRCWGFMSGIYSIDNFYKKFKNIKQLSTGSQFICILDEGGDIYCSGINDYGQFGNGTKSNDKQPNVDPIKVVTDKKFSYLISGANFNCAIEQSTDELYCWGSNDSYQLGYKPNPSQVEALYPQKVVGLPPILSPEKFLSTGPTSTHVCAFAGSKFLCWGSNTGSQLGVSGSTKKDSAPMEFPLTKPLTRFRVNESHTIFGMANFDLSGKPLNEQIMKVGFRNGSSSHIPIEVLSSIKKPDIESIHSTGDIDVALLKNGNIYTSGKNTYGHVGFWPFTSDNKQYTHIDAVRDKVSVGFNQVCAWKEGSRAWCWGKNGSGQVIENGPPQILNPTLIPW